MARIKSYNSLSDLYSSEQLGTAFDQVSELTIHRLELAHPEPVRSPVFRANYYSFVLISQGKTQYSIDGHVFNTKPRTLYFTNPGHLKSFTIEEPARGFLITLTENYLVEHLDRRVFDDFGFLLTEMVPPCFLSESEFTVLRDLCISMEQEYNGESQLKIQITSSYLKIFLLRIKEFILCNNSFTEEYNRESQIVNTFKKNLESHFRQFGQGKIKRFYNVQDFAQLQHLHPNYLSTVIRTKTGISPHAYIRDKIISEAKALLLKSDYSIKQIAYELCFQDPTNFSKFFKKECGYSPAAYRKKHKS